MSVHNGNGRFKPGMRFNFWEAVHVVALEDIKTADILVPVGIRGNHMTVKRADIRHKELSVGPLFVSKHDIPGPRDGKITDSNLGVALPWFVNRKGVDTTSQEAGQPLYLSAGGKYDYEPYPGHPERIVGKILEAGPPAKDDDGFAGCGTVLIKV